MSNEVSFHTKSASVTIALGDVLDVSTLAEAMEDRKSYIMGPPTYTIRVGSWEDFVACLRALDPTLTEESLRQQVLDQKLGAWRVATTASGRGAVMGNAGNAGNA